eukprot:TRINITY_DN48736_c0_g1_i1.p1 TRINITY_DN48736_c0_g1~~TRINITY_DN48736_c0_g1_i1.p1  ORF type:complete len:352 (-),score=41.70 TRINITY_DN48736_c0_g1_i1:191-1246(-)
MKAWPDAETPHSPSLEELLAAGRFVSILHSYLYLKPASALKYLDPDVREYLLRRHGGILFKLQVFLTLAALAALPWAYAMTAMPNRCKEETLYYIETNSTATFKGLNCVVEEILTQPSDGLIWGGGSVAAGIVFTVLQTMLTDAFGSLSARSNFWYKVSYWHNYLSFKLLESTVIKRMMPDLCFSNAWVLGTPSGGHVTLASVITMGMAVLVLQFATIAVWTGQYALGAVVGFAVVKLYASIIDVGICQNDETRSIVIAEIKKWRSEEDTIPVLHDLMIEETSRSVLCMTTPVLMSIASLDNQKAAHKRGGRLLARKIYLTDQNCVLDLLNGKLSARTEKSRSYANRTFTS